MADKKSPTGCSMVYKVFAFVLILGPRGFGGLGRSLFLFRELGGTGIYFQGFGEQVHSLGGFREPCKKSKKISP